MSIFIRLPQGFYHAPAFGRESLASDLVEVERSRVDAWALGLFNRQDLRVEDFSSNADGCFLGKAGRARFYQAWEPMAENLRKALDAQACDLLKLIGVHEETPPTDAQALTAWDSAFTAPGQTSVAEGDVPCQTDS